PNFESRIVRMPSDQSASVDRRLSASLMRSPDTARTPDRQRYVQGCRRCVVGIFFAASRSFADAGRVAHENLQSAAPWFWHLLLRENSHIHATRSANQLIHRIAQYARP